MYDQASIYERYEFYQSKNQFWLILDYIENRITRYLDDKNPVKLNAKKAMIYESIATNWVIDEVIETRYKIHKSIYTGWGGRPAIEQSNIVTICKELNLTPHELIHEYTMEEFMRYLDGIIYNNNEWSEDGRGKNDMARLANDEWTVTKQKNFEEMGKLLDSLDKK